MVSRKRIAREWLYFVLGIAAGVLLVTLVGVMTEKALIDHKIVRGLSSVWSGETTILGEFFGPSTLTPWLILFFPYLVFQLVRSIIWAVRVLRAVSQSRLPAGMSAEESRRRLGRPHLMRSL
jgi:hypothetical protein